MALVRLLTAFGSYIGVSRVPGFVRGILIVGAVAALLVAAGTAIDGARATTITLDADTRYQTIDSWPVYPRYWEHDKVNNRFDDSFVPYIESLSRFLVNEVGIDGVRIEIWSGLENPIDHWTRFFEGRNTYREDKKVRYEKINDNDDPFSVKLAGFQFAKFDFQIERKVLPLKRAVEANGERLYINVNYVDFLWGSDQGSLNHARNPDEFAEFVLVFFTRLRDKYGILPDSFEIVLEPNNTEDWRGPEIGRALTTVRERLKAEGFTPEFVAPSGSTISNSLQYFDAMVEVPGVVEALDTFAYHRYGAERQTDLQRVWRRAKARGLKTAMLEKVGAGIDELLQDLTVAQVSSWQQWAAAGLAKGKDKGAYYILADIGDGGDPQISMAKQTAYLAHVFKYVRNGATRIGAASDNADKRPVAFVNQNTAWAIIVRAKKAGGPLTFVGLPAGRYGLRFTGEDRKTEPWPTKLVEAGQALKTELPGPGVITVYKMKSN